MRQTLLQNAAAFLLKNATKVYYKMRQVFYYKMQQFISKCDSYYKLHRFCYIILQLLQNATFITKYGDTLSNLTSAEDKKILVP